MKKTIIALLTLLTAATATAQKHTLWYEQPAHHWLEALPVGNSQLGAMVFGGTDVETLAMNEETFWSGGPHDNNSAGARRHLQEVRDLVFAGREEEAHKVLDKYFFPGPHGMRFLPVGNVRLTLGHRDVSQYRRELDLGNAVCTTTYIYKGVRYERTVFASLTDHVIVVRLTADKKGALAFGVDFATQLQSKVFTVSRHEGIDGEVDELAAVVDGVEQEGIKAALKAECRIMVETDGKVARGADKLSVDDATTATLYISAATNFVNYQDVSGNPVKRNNAVLAAVKGKSYGKLLDSHVRKYQEQYNRVQLTLPKTANSGMATDRRLAAFDGTDLDMVALMMQYGRYLLISSSQPGGQPANLQGVWNDKMNAPWDSKYTININTEMNYWPSMVGNLVENQEPLLHMIRDLSVTGSKTADVMYGCRGWVAHHNTDLWRIAGPVDGTTWGMFPTGGAWLTTHIWQQYLFTGNRQLLEEYYPVMKGAAEFLVDYMRIQPEYGWLVTVPTVSPEHGPMGKYTTVTAGSTMDNQIVFDVLTQVTKAAKVLGKDDDYSDIIAQLPPMQVGKHGQLQEWLWDGDNPNDEHRHISHLYGLSGRW